VRGLGAEALSAWMIAQLGIAYAPARLLLWLWLAITSTLLAIARFEA
jgi:hypothetical protein